MKVTNAKIRRAKPGDELAIHEAHMRSIREVCVKDHGTEEIRGWGYRTFVNPWTGSIADHFVWVVANDESIFGYGYFRMLPDTENPERTAYLNALYLTPEILGLGFGHALMKLIFKEAKNLHAKKMKLESSITAHDFYKRLGFRDSGPKIQIEIGGHAVTAFPMEFTL